jgi:hypothetical protein
MLFDKMIKCLNDYTIKRLLFLAVRIPALLECSGRFGQAKIKLVKSGFGPFINQGLGALLGRGKNNGKLAEIYPHNVLVFKFHSAGIPSLVLIKIIQSHSYLIHGRNGRFGNSPVLAGGSAPKYYH